MGGDPVHCAQHKARRLVCHCVVQREAAKPGPENLRIVIVDQRSLVLAREVLRHAEETLGKGSRAHAAAAELNSEQIVEQDGHKIVVQHATGSRVLHHKGQDRQTLSALWRQ